jgi:hypothetical protein
MRLRVPQKIRHYLVINLCIVFNQVAGNIVSLISAALPLTTLNIGDPAFSTWRTMNRS